MASVAVAPQGDRDREADVVKDGQVHNADAPRQAPLRDRVDPIAVDDGWHIDTDVGSDRDLDGQPTRLRRDLRDRDIGPDVEDVVSSQHHDRSGLSTHLGEPDLATPHG